MKPQAARERFDVRHEGENVVLTERKGGREIVLDPIAGAVWLRADGSHDVRELAAVAGRDLDALVGEPEVWAALDALGDAGLLEGRVAPPADTGVSRRFLLRTAAVAGTLFVGTAGVAVAADKDRGDDNRADTSELGRWRSAAEQAQKGEQSAKTQESRAKDSLGGVTAREQHAKGAENDAKASAEQAHKGADRVAAAENNAKASAEQAHKASVDLAGKEDLAKASAESWNKAALDDLHALQASREELAKLQVKEQGGKQQIADEQAGKASAESREKASGQEQGQKQAQESASKQAQESASKESGAKAPGGGSAPPPAPADAPPSGGAPGATPPPA